MSTVEESRTPEIAEAGAQVSEKSAPHEHGAFDIEEVVPDQAVEAYVF